MLALACALVVLPATAPAAGQLAAAAEQAKSWTIDSLNVVLEVQENGDVVADETFAYTFIGNYHFVERNVPLDACAGHHRYRGARRERCSAAREQ